MKIKAEDKIHGSWIIYEDDSANVICIVCGDRKKITAQSLKAVQAEARKNAPLSHWSEFARCYDCWKNSQEAKKRAAGEARKDDYVRGAEWGMAYNLAFNLVLKRYNKKGYPMLTPEYFLEVEAEHETILAHIKEFKQKTLN